MFKEHIQRLEEQIKLTQEKEGWIFGLSVAQCWQMCHFLSCFCYNNHSLVLLSKAFCFVSFSDSASVSVCPFPSISHSLPCFLC